MKNKFSKFDGGLAFPGGHGCNGGPERGMTLRDYFAGQTASAFISASLRNETTAASFAVIRKKGDFNSSADLIAKMAYKTADALLTEREIKNDTGTRSI